MIHKILTSAQLLLALLLASLLTLMPALPASAASYTTIAGDTSEFNSEQPQQNTVLIFWASWCGYCMQEIPHLKELSNEFSELRWLGINVNKEPADGLEIEQKRELPWVSLADPDLQIADQFSVRGTPGLLIINQSGDVVSVAVVLMINSARLFPGLRQTKLNGNPDNEKYIPADIYFLFTSD